MWNYPNGKTYTSKLAIKNNINSSSIPKKNITDYSNRGQSLEDDINQSNQYYLERGIAVIHKKPTPIQIVKVEYPKRSAARITEAYFRTASTTDYNGVFQGKYVDFEAKETKNKTSFPLNNIHEHQILHLKSIAEHGGIGFFILKFSTLEEAYVLKSEDVIPFWDKKETNRKSIPKSFIEEKGVLIPIGFNPRYDYLKALEKMI